MNWGWRIFILYVGFVIMTLSMVFFTMKQDVFLVSRDYYKQEIEYQDQIDRISNTKALAEPLKMVHLEAERSLMIVFPTAHAQSGILGEVHLFRPSDARLDRRYAINADKMGRQYISLDELKTGNWRVKISWEAIDEAFYEEQNLDLK